MNPELLTDYTHVPSNELGDVLPTTEVLDELDFEAIRVGGCVRWHRPSCKPVVALKVAGRWIARL